MKLTRRGLEPLRQRLLAELEEARSARPIDREQVYRLLLVIQATERVPGMLRSA